MMAGIRSPLLATLVAAMVSACGGGGSGTTSPATPVNQAPVFTSAAAVTVSENFTGVVARISATDSEGSPITYALAGGPDAGRFSLNATTHELRFIAPPDFEP